jgi:hypothetical protein
MLGTRHALSARTSGVSCQSNLSKGTIGCTGEGHSAAVTSPRLPSVGSVPGGLDRQFEIGLAVIAKKGWRSRGSIRCHQSYRRFSTFLTSASTAGSVLLTTIAYPAGFKCQRPTGRGGDSTARSVRPRFMSFSR